MTKINFWQRQITSNNTIDFTINGANAGIVLPSGTTAERPITPVDGTFRLNTTTSQVEIYQLGGWKTVSTVTNNTIGEVNTVSSLGTGNSIFAGKVGVDFQLKSLKAGTNLNIGVYGSELIFNADRIIDFPTISNIDSTDSITIWDATLGKQTKSTIGTFFTAIGGSSSIIDPTTITSFQSNTLWYGGVPYWWNGTTYASDPVSANALPLAGGTMSGNIVLSNLVQILANPNSSALSPTYSFNNDTDTGIYRSAANTLKISTGGIDAVTVGPTQNTTFAKDVTVAGNFNVRGTTTSVNSTIVNIADNIINLNSGETGAGITLGSGGINIDRGTSTDATLIYNEATHLWEIGLVGSTTPVWHAGYQGSGTGMDSDLLDGLDSTAFPLVANNLSDLTNISTARVNLGLVSGGAGDIWVDTAGDTMTGNLIMNTGAQIQGDASATLTTPAFSFDTSTNTGMYLAATDTIGFSAGGANVITMKSGIGTDSSIVINATDSITLPNGTSSQRPTVAVNGMFRYNNTINKLEGYINGSWTSLDSGGLGLQIANNLSDLPNVATARTNLGLVSGGTGDIWVDTAGDTMTGNLLMGFNAQIQGANTATNTAPAYSFSTNTNTGMYSIATNAIGFSSGGVKIITMKNGLGIDAALTINTTDAIAIPNGTTLQRPSSPIDGMIRHNSSLSRLEGFINGAWTGIDAGGLGLQIANNLSDLSNVASARTNLGLISGGAGDIWVDTSGDTMTGNLIMGVSAQIQGDGTATSIAPTYSFGNNSNTGIYRTALDIIGFSSGGINVVDIKDGAGVDASLIVNTTDAIELPSGTTSQRPSTPINGMMRYNNTTGKLESYISGAWLGLDAGGLGLQIANNLSDLANIATSRANLGLVSGGTGDIWVDASGDTMTGNLIMGVGAQLQGDGFATSALPTYSFGANSNTGMFRSAVDTIGFSSGGTDIVDIKNGAGVNASLIVNTTDAIEIPNGTTTQRPTTPTNGMFRYNSTLGKMEGYISGSWTSLDAGGLGLQIANNLSDVPNKATARTNLGLNSGGAGDIWVDAAGDTMTGNLIMSGGSQIHGDSSATLTTPAFSFDTNTNTGMYLAAVDTIGFSSGGTNIVDIKNGAGINSSIVINTTDAIELPTGTTAQRPSIPTNGMFRYNSTLGKIEAYASGSWSSVAVGGTGLQIANNLSDLANVATARTNLGLVSGGTGDIWVDAAGDTMTGNLTMGGGAQILGDGGSGSIAPAYSFGNDSGSGMYNVGVSNVGISVGGSQRIDVKNQNGINASFSILSNDAVGFPSGNTAQRPSTPVNGMLRYNNSLNKFEGYINGAWTVLGGTTTYTSTTYTGNGGTTVYSTGTSNIQSVDYVEVFWDGIRQIPSVDYTLSGIGPNITFSTAPPTGVKVFIKTTTQT